MKNSYSYILHLLFLISFVINIFLFKNSLFLNKPVVNDSAINKTDSTVKKSGFALPYPKKHATKVFSVYILPHPPDFLEGRRLEFVDFDSSKENGKTWVMFTEKKNDGLSQTRVDSEAIRW